MSTDVSLHNRRENQVRLTPAGDALVRRGDTAYGTARHALLPDLDPGDLSAAIRILTALNAALDPGAPPLPDARRPEPSTTGRDSSGKEQHNRPA
jgi:DNA-binding transcriptional LysR family regulator